MFEGAVTEVEVDFVLGQRSLLTVHEPAGTRSRCTRCGATRRVSCRRGPDYLLYAIIDGIVDGYFPVLDAIEDEIDALQDDVIRKPTHVDAGAAVRAQARAGRPAPRHVNPAREIFNQLTNRDLGSSRRSTSSTSATSTTT